MATSNSDEHKDMEMATSSSDEHNRPRVVLTYSRRPMFKRIKMQNAKITELKTLVLAHEQQLLAHKEHLQSLQETVQALRGLVESNTSKSPFLQPRLASDAKPMFQNKGKRKVFEPMMVPTTCPVKCPRTETEATLCTDLMNDCKKILESLKAFLQDIIPDYDIKNCLDLGTIDNKLREGEYISPVQFAEDVRLTFINATTYNQAGHWANNATHSLLGHFETAWKGLSSKLEQLAHFEEDEPNNERVDAPPPIPTIQHISHENSEPNSPLGQQQDQMPSLDYPNSALRLEFSNSMIISEEDEANSESADAPPVLTILDTGDENSEPKTFLGQQQDQMALQDDQNSELRVELFNSMTTSEEDEANDESANATPVPIIPHISKQSTDILELSNSMKISEEAKVVIDSSSPPPSQLPNSPSLPLSLLADTTSNHHEKHSTAPDAFIDMGDYEPEWRYPHAAEELNDSPEILKLHQKHSPATPDAHVNIGTSELEGKYPPIVLREKESSTSSSRCDSGSSSVESGSSSMESGSSSESEMTDDQKAPHPPASQYLAL
ncbi:hypothetical protein GOP47_0007274 [Adiantum capillus-veneris]|uniref:Bromo domain-containing protein n=1 Tax=Adiantum capillus-veneris TaxID=13818 RepID=A0A9D4V102_ADICA|nr:hypothetical protein GOP47_0007274 [Adiantum capillus-veneris]